MNPKATRRDESANAQDRQGQEMRPRCEPANAQTDDPGRQGPDAQQCEPANAQTDDPGWQGPDAQRREPANAQTGDTDWQGVDARLRELARRSATQEWELGCALLLARQTRAHERLGFASLFQYVERLFGYSPRMIAERLRVADALRELPELERALRDGQRTWSAVRELTRVAAPETESEWLAFSAGKTVRELEQAVSGLRLGDSPGDPPDPHMQRKVIRVEVSPECWALFKDAMARLRREVDPRLSEEDAFAEMCRRALGVAGDSGAAPYQVALTVCEHCSRTWQDAGGESIELPAEVGEAATCDAQCVGRVGGRPADADAHVGRPADEETHVGRLADEDAHVGRPADEDTRVGGRATRTIPPATRRLVYRRDKGRCRTPGCRNHTWLSVHHLTPRAEGGGHKPSNLILLCGAHHALHHRGLLLIDGSTEQVATFAHADGTPYGDAPRPVQVQANSEAHAALRSLGFTETESRQALAAARTQVADDARTEELVREALRHHHRVGRAA